ncbi:sensor histidine kinase [Pedosphaera parvula]|uniref:Histidine kinase n=1 Tax=Pedosphaera parvula (strain Ellin514) TaxID=320771 RepID=B9XHL0_PEDPL|nr:histidine kinase [Pedosphaera parvula]EEF60588.1 histidine kinase [Pedosphaera parvula Ellin514]
MTRPTVKKILILLGSWIGFLALAHSELASNTADGFEIRSASAANKQLSIRQNEVNLGALPTQITFRFWPRTNNPSSTMRVRYKLEGYEDVWHDGTSEMFVAIRFYNEAQDQVGQKVFTVSGESVGWRGSLATSSLTHRREMFTCPPGTAQFWVVITSAGPPAAVGAYIVANLKVSKITTNGPPVELITWPLDSEPRTAAEPAVVKGWRPDGGRPSMARIVTIGENPSQKAFGIFDTDGTTHAEWHTTVDAAPRAQPGDQMLIEWDEMYSIGVNDMTAAHFSALPVGRYVLHVENFDVLGRPTGIQASLNVIVPPPFWLKPAFWGFVITLLVVLVLGIGRYLTARRMQREVVRLRWREDLEKERLRIARDIHDDLGARLTEISLASELAKGKQNLPKFATEDFDQISGMCREMVTALYETVWAVNPKNDNLDALGEYLCQISIRLCEQAHLSCRLQVAELPKNVEISSRDRHNIAMSVTEAVHNVIKHAKASEVILSVDFESEVLNISVQDNGCGFVEANVPGRNGLNNMRERQASIGGTCRVESRASGGTTVYIRVTIDSRHQHS